MESGPKSFLLAGGRTSLFYSAAVWAVVVAYRWWWAP